MSYLIRRVLAKPRLILDEMCHLYGKFASYFSSYKWPYCDYRPSMFHLPNDLNIFVFPSGTESFPDITSPISPDTDDFKIQRKKKDYYI